MLEFYRRNEAVILGTLSLASIGVFWQFVVDAGIVNPFFISTPVEVFHEASAQLDSGKLYKNTAASMYSFVLALGLATIMGILLGVLAGWFRDVESVLEPFIWFKYSAPTIAFYPLFVAWLGYGTPTIVAIAFLCSDADLCKHACWH